MTAPRDVKVDLLPCPFCGGEPEMVSGFSTSIKCSNDQCVSRVDMGGFNFYNHKPDAITAWNTRAPDRALADVEAENERLRGINGELVSSHNTLLLLESRATTRAETAEAALAAATAPAARLGIKDASTATFAAGRAVSGPAPTPAAAGQGEAVCERCHGAGRVGVGNCDYVECHACWEAGRLNTHPAAVREAGEVTEAMVGAGAALSKTNRSQDPHYRARIRAILEAAALARDGGGWGVTAPRDVKVVAWIERFDLDRVDYEYRMEEWPEGEWVRYSDHARALADVEAENERLRVYAYLGAAYALRINDEDEALNELAGQLWYKLTKDQRDEATRLIVGINSTFPDPAALAAATALISEWERFNSTFGHDGRMPTAADFHKALAGKGAGS